MTDRRAFSQSPSMKPGAVPSPPEERPAGATEFRRIFDREFEYLWRSLRRLGIPQRDLEDITHEVFLQVYAQLDRYDTARPIRPWLFGFAFRVASDYRRLARHRFEKLDGEIDSPDEAPAAIDRLVEAEALVMGHEALACLDLPWRAVFILHELDGCTVPEIARSLAIPLNTAYSRLRAAREQFNAAVRRIRLQRGLR